MSWSLLAVVVVAAAAGAVAESYTRLSDSESKSTDWRLVERTTWHHHHHQPFACMPDVAERAQSYKLHASRDEEAVVVVVELLADDDDDVTWDDVDDDQPVW